MGEISKICTLCRVRKPIEQFGKNKRHNDGHTYRCKKCKNKLEKLYCDANRNHIREYRKNFYRENIAENWDDTRAWSGKTKNMKEYQRTYRIKNLERIKAYHKA
jgi:hypothetical protein